MTALPDFVTLGVVGCRRRWESMARTRAVRSGTTEGDRPARERLPAGKASGVRAYAAGESALGVEDQPPPTLEPTCAGGARLCRCWGEPDRGVPTGEGFGPLHGRQRSENGGLGVVPGRFGQS